jgi:PAS domain S-box-containing protein
LVTLPSKRSFDIRSPDPRLLRQIMNASWVLLAVAAAIGAVVLIGWLAPALGAALPAGWALMKANTALAVLLCAASLALSRQHRSARPHVVGAACAAVVLVLAGAALFEHGSGRVSGLGTMLAADLASPFPGRMSIQTALSLVLLAVSCLLGPARRGRAVDVTLLTLVALCLAMFTGAALGAWQLLGQSPTTRTSPQTLICLICLTLALALRRAPYGGYAVLLGNGISSHFARIVLLVALCTPLIVRLVISATSGRTEIDNLLSAGLSTTVITILLFFVVLMAARILNREERALQQETALLTAILNGTEHAIIVGDERGIVHFNRAAERLLGYRAEEVVGKHTAALFHDPAELLQRAQELSTRLGLQVAPSVEDFLAAAREGWPGALEWTYIRKDGSRVPVLLSVTALRDPEGGVASLVGIVQDDKHRKEAQQVLQQAHATMADALQRAEQADRTKSMFLASMSHELRTPLNSIIGFTGILLQGQPGPLTAEQQRQLAMVRGSARHLLALINDILDISRIEAGEVRLQVEQFDPIEAVQQAAAMIAPAAQDKGLALRLDLDRLSPNVELLADRRRFHQVLLNLLNNAVKFTEHGSVTVSAKSEGGRLTVTVADTGIGIVTEELGGIFEPFRQVGAGLARSYEGTGLGLAISRRLAKLMGGTLTVASAPGRGSTFCFSLPLAQEAV